MKLGIAGAGAIGCHYGVLLQQAGCEVTLLARGAHLDAMRRGGLLHESGGTVSRIEVEATDRTPALRDCDVILLCCKMTGLQAMLDALAAVVADDALLVTLQNGVEAPAVAASVFPRHALLAGTAFIGARLEGPAHVIHSAAGGIRLAPWRQGTGDRHVDALLQALAAAGVPARMEDDAQRMLWRKLLWNCGFNAITAITRRFARDVAADPGTLAVIRDAMRETLTLALACGIGLSDEDMEKHIRVTLEMGPVKTSMWQDIEAGRATEVDHINGYVARASARLGLDAPVNRMLAALLHAIEAGGA